MIEFTEKYWDDVIIRMTYNSNAIENSTLTLPETMSILIYKTTPKGKDLREVYEAVNHAEAFNLMIEKINDHEAISHKTILDLHYVLMDKLNSNRGQFKKNENMIIGADFETASPISVPELIDDWCWSLDYGLKHVDNFKDACKLIAGKHIEFERIHPFDDGNGRIGRLLINYSLLEKGFPACIIPKEEKLEYIEFLVEEDAEGLGEFFIQLCIAEYERGLKFGVNYDLGGKR